jgi:hypothetical protein
VVSGASHQTGRGTHRRHDGIAFQRIPFALLAQS